MTSKTKVMFIPKNSLKVYSLIVNMRLREFEELERDASRAGIEFITVPTDVLGKHEIYLEGIISTSEVKKDDK